MEAIVNYMKTKFLYIDPLKQGLKPIHRILINLSIISFYT